jgi:hypothetical protein
MCTTPRATTGNVEDTHVTVALWTVVATGGSMGGAVLVGVVGVGLVGVAVGTGVSVGMGVGVAVAIVVAVLDILSVASRDAARPGVAAVAIVVIFVCLIQCTLTSMSNGGLPPVTVSVTGGR